MSAPSPASDGRGSQLAVALAVGLLIAAAVWLLSHAGGLQGADLWLYDRLVVRAGVAPGTTPPVTLIQIREEEIARFGHPLSDGLLAQALAWLAAQEPRAIGIDLYRDQPVGPESGRSELAALTEATPGLVFIEKLPEPDQPGVAAPEFARYADSRGFSDVVTDPDGRLRRGLLLLWDQDGRPSLSFALQLALHYLRAEGVRLEPDPADPEAMRLGATSIAPLEPRDGGYAGVDAGGYQVLLDFAAGRHGFLHFALDDVLAARVPEAMLRDRIVVVGTTAASVKDDFATPLAGGAIHGIEAHAHLADQLVRWARGEGRPMRFWSEAGEAGWLLAWSVGTALAAGAARGPRWLIAGLAGSALALVALSATLLQAGWWIPTAGPLLASLGAGGLVLLDVTRRERAERALIMDLFGRYVSKTVAEELWARRGEFMEGRRPLSRRLRITAMLTDLKGYTSAAERMDPAALMDWVNEYMDTMTQVIEAHGGFVDDYTGDGIKANFGVPLADETPDRVRSEARTATRCALEMGRALEKLDAEWTLRGLPTARMRIGLYTGEAVVGSLGSRDRMKYTTVGDTVNTAARLESFRKEEFEAEAAAAEGPVFRVLVGGSTQALLGDEFETEFLGEYVLRGRGAAVAIYRVRGWKKEEQLGTS